MNIRLYCFTLLLLSGSPIFSDPLFAAVLEQTQVLLDEVDGIDGLNGASSIVISPDGKHVYVTGTNDDALVVFLRNIASGSLSLVEIETHRSDAIDGLWDPDSIALSPDGKHLYVSSQKRNTLAVFRRDVVTGQVDFVDAYADPTGTTLSDHVISSVTVSPDGANVIAANSIQDLILVYSRDVSSGRLTLTESIEMERRILGLPGYAEATISPDGRHIYWVSREDSSLQVVHRNEFTNTLEIVQKLYDGEVGVDGLNGAISSIVSPDGKNVYVISPAEFGISLFDRNLNTGDLQFVDIYRDGVGDVEGLSEAWAASVNPDGSRIFTVGFDDDAVSVFSRDRTTGRLTFLEVAKNEISGITGLNGASSVATSPDGAHIYVTAYIDDAISVFNVSDNSPSPSLDNDQGINGLFYDPNNSGHGFDINVLQAGIVIYYYGHTFSGERLWLISDVYSFDLEFGEEYEMNMYEVIDGVFGSPGPSTTPWGTITIRFNDCDSGHAEFTGGDGNLTMDFIRLAGLQGIGCQ